MIICFAIRASSCLHIFLKLLINQTNIFSAVVTAQYFSAVVTAQYFSAVVTAQYFSAVVTAQYF
jgi:hypothetical protein